MADISPCLSQTICPMQEMGFSSQSAMCQPHFKTPRLHSEWVAKLKDNSHCPRVPDKAIPGSSSPRGQGKKAHHPPPPCLTSAPDVLLPNWLACAYMSHESKVMTAPTPSSHKLVSGEMGEEHKYSKSFQR